MSDKSETCGMCEGQGVTGIAGHLCDRCNGTGVTTTGEVAGTLPSTREPSCSLCGDTGTVHFKGGDENCAACHARIVLDTDSPLPSTPDPVNPGEFPSPTITVTTSGAATPPYPDRYLGTPTNDGAKGEMVGAGTADRGSLGAGIAELSATIAEQAAEIETRTSERDALSRQLQRLIIEQANKVNGLVEENAAQAAEIERLIRVHGEQMETIIRQGEQIVDLSKERASARAALEAERDAADERCRILAEERNNANQRFWGIEADAKRYALNAEHHREKAEKYLAVIDATNAHAATMVNLLMAMADAGLRMPPYLPYPAKQGEADHG